MSVTYYVALPFIRTEDGSAPGQAQECPGESGSIRIAKVPKWSVSPRELVR